jgi:hypothetical protein
MSFEPGERDRRSDAISLSQKCGTSKGSYAAPASIADALRGGDFAIVLQETFAGGHSPKIEADNVPKGDHFMDIEVC